MKKQFTYIKKIILLIFITVVAFISMPNGFDVNFNASTETALRQYAPWRGQDLLEKRVDGGTTYTYGINNTMTQREIKSSYNDPTIVWNANKKNYIYFSDLYNGANNTVLTTIPSGANSFVVIENAYDLFYFSRACHLRPTQFLGLNYLLGNDIDYSKIPSSYEFYPIGYLSSNPFTGTFNGQGFEISNLVMVTIDGDDAFNIFGDLIFFSPFSRLSSTAVVSYLGMINLEVYLTYNAGNMHYASGIVGYNAGNVNHVFYRDEREDRGSFGGQGFKVSSDFVVSGLVSQNASTGILNNAYVAAKSMHDRSFDPFPYSTNQYLICGIIAGTVTTSTIFYDYQITTNDTRQNPNVGQGGTSKNTDNFTAYAGTSEGLNSPSGFTNWYFAKAVPNGPTTNAYYTLPSSAYWTDSMEYPSLLGIYFTSTAAAQIYTPAQLVKFPRIVEQKTIFKDPGNSTSFITTINADLDMHAVAKDAYVPPSTPYTKYLQGIAWYNYSTYQPYQLYQRGTTTSYIADATTIGGYSNRPTIFNLNLSTPVKYNNVLAYGLLGYYTNYSTTYSGYLNFVEAKIDINPTPEMLDGVTKLSAGVFAGYIQYIYSTSYIGYIAASVDIKVSTTTNLPAKTSIGGLVGETYGALYFNYANVNGNVSLGDNKTGANIKELNAGGVLGASNSTTTYMYYILSHVNVQGAGKLGAVDRTCKLNVGGIAGNTYRGTYNYLYSDGTITSMPTGGQAGFQYIAGIFGKIHATASSSNTLSYITFDGTINAQLPDNITNQIDFYLSGVVNTASTSETFLSLTSCYSYFNSVTNYGKFNIINRNGTTSKTNTYTEAELERFKGQIAGVATTSYGFHSAYNSYGLYNFTDIDVDLALFNTISGIQIINRYYYLNTDGTYTASTNFGSNNSYYDSIYGSKAYLQYNYGNITARSYNILTDYDYDIAGVKAGQSARDYEAVNLGDINIYLDHRTTRLHSSTPFNYSGTVYYHNIAATNTNTPRAINMYVGGIYSSIYSYSNYTSQLYNKGNVNVYTNASFTPSTGNEQTLNLMVGGNFGNMGGYETSSTSAYGTVAAGPNTATSYLNYNVNEGNIYVSTKVYGEVSVGGIAGVRGSSYSETYTYSFDTLFDSYNIGDVYVENAVRPRISTESTNFRFGVAAGGLIGSLITYSLWVTNCANYGTVVARSLTNVEIFTTGNYTDYYTTGVSAGGIIGYSYIRNYGILPMNSSSTSSSTYYYTNIQDTINYGNIYAYVPNVISTANYQTFLPASAGGILGRGIASIMFCINYGRVYSSYTAGGIIGLFTYEPYYSTLTSYSRQGMVWGLINYGNVGYLSSAFSVTIGTSSHSGTITSVSGLVDTKPAPTDYVHPIGGIVGKIQVNANRLHTDGLWYPNKIPTINLYFFRFGAMINMNPNKNGIGVVPPADGQYFDINSQFFGKNGRLNRYNVTLSSSDTTGNSNANNTNGSPYYFNYLSPTTATNALFDPNGRFIKNPVLASPSNLNGEYTDNYLEEIFTKYFQYVPWASVGTDLRNTVQGFMGGTLAGTATGIFVLTDYNGKAAATKGVEYWLGGTTDTWIRGTNGIGKRADRPDGNGAVLLTTNAVVSTIYEQTNSTSNRLIVTTQTSMVQATAYPNLGAATAVYNPPTSITVNIYNSLTGALVGNISSTRYISTPSDNEYKGVYEFEISEGSANAVEKVGIDGVVQYNDLKTEVYITVEDAFAMGMTMPYTNVPLGYYTNTGNGAPQNQFFIPYIGNYMLDGSDFVPCGPYSNDGLYNITSATNINYVGTPTLNTYRAYYTTSLLDNRSAADRLAYPLNTNTYATYLFEKNGVAVNTAYSYNDITSVTFGAATATFGQYKYNSLTNSYVYAGPNTAQTYVKITVLDDSSSITYFHEPNTTIGVYKYSTNTAITNGFMLSTPATSLTNPLPSTATTREATLLRSYGPYGSGILSVTSSSATDAGIPAGMINPSGITVLDTEDAHNGFITIRNNLTLEEYKYQIRIKRIPAQTMDELWYSIDSYGYSNGNYNTWRTDGDLDSIFLYDRRYSANYDGTSGVANPHINTNVDLKDFYCDPSPNHDYALLDAPNFVTIPTNLATGYVINNYDGNSGDRSQLDIESYYQSKYKTAYKYYGYQQTGSPHNDPRGNTYAGTFSFAYRTNNMSVAYMTTMYNNITSLDYITRDSGGNITSITPTTNYTKTYYLFGVNQTKPDPLFGTWGPGNFGFSIIFQYAGLSGEYRIKFTIEDGTVYYLTFFRDNNDAYGIWNYSSTTTSYLSAQYYQYAYSGNSITTTNNYSYEYNKSATQSYTVTLPFGSFYSNGVSGSSPMMNFTNFDAVNQQIATNKGTDIGVPVESYYYSNLHNGPNVNTRYVLMSTLNSAGKLIPSNLETTSYPYIYFAEFEYFVGVDLSITSTNYNYGYTVTDSGVDYTQYTRRTYTITYKFATQRDVALLGNQAPIKTSIFIVTEDTPIFSLQSISRDGTTFSLPTTQNLISFPKNETPRYRANFTISGSLVNSITHPIETKFEYLGTNFSQFQSYYDVSSPSYTFSGYEIYFPRKSRPGEYKITQKYTGYPWAITFNGATTNINSEYYFKQLSFEKSANKNSRLGYIGFDTEFPVMSGNNIIGKWDSYTGNFDYYDEILEEQVFVNVDEGAIFLDAYTYWMTADGRTDRPMNISSGTGIDYSAVDAIYGTYTTYYTSNTYYLIGQVQKTNLSNYTPIFNLPELGYIAKITDEEHIYNPYAQQTQYQWELQTFFPGTPDEYEDYVFIVNDVEQNDLDNPNNYLKNPYFSADFAGSPGENELWYIHYRLYAEAYSFDIETGENNGYYTDYYISVQDATNNVYYSIDVVTDELSKPARFALPQVFITFFAYENDSQSPYNGSLMLEMSLFSIFALDGADDRVQLGDNLQFRNVMGGHYVIVLDLPIGYDFYLTSTSRFVVPDGIGSNPNVDQMNAKWDEHNVKSYNISKSIVLRRYPITIHIYENGDVDDWGQIGIFPYHPNA